MTNRKVELVVSPPPHHWVGDGFRVHNFIPGVRQLSMERMSPFIMMDYNSKHIFPGSDKPFGVGVHPHRGFETVTIAYKGKVQHHDSAGGGGIIGEGDIQWMTAASGVLHKEYHEKEWSKKGGEFQMVQLWVNLPARYKMSAPKYQAILNESLGKFKVDEQGSVMEIIAGEYKGIAGQASTFSPVHMFNAKLKKGAFVDLSFPSDYNTALLVLEGSISIQESGQSGNSIVTHTEEYNNVSVPLNHLALMENKGEDFKVLASEDAIVLILSGEPLNEPIAPYGPFVMNTRQELIQAYEDYDQGKFGHLED